MAVPIFVVGKHRSGTTWLANLLCKHSQVAGVQHEKHHGIHESVFFSRVDKRYGDLSGRSNYIEMVQVLSASDYFTLAGASSDFLYSLWPTTYSELFRSVMDRFASNRGCSYWVEKTPAHTLYVDRLASTYPDALFIGIVRDVEEVVASSLARHSGSQGQKAGTGLRRKLSAVKTVFSWVYYNKVLRWFSARSDRILLVRYSSLRSDVSSQLRKICTFLGVPFEFEMCDTKFAPNTSFVSSGERKRTLSRWESIVVQCCSVLFGLMPGWLAMNLARMRRDRHRGPLPSWFFRLNPVAAGGSESSENGKAAVVATEERVRKTVRDSA